MEITPDQIKTIVETIKTWNVNFNDPSFQKLIEQIQPTIIKYFEFQKWSMMFGLFEGLLITLEICAVIAMIGVAIRWIVREVEKGSCN